MTKMRAPGLLKIVRGEDSGTVVVRSLGWSQTSKLMTDLMPCQQRHVFCDETSPTYSLGSFVVSRVLGRYKVSAAFSS